MKLLDTALSRSPFMLIDMRSESSQQNVCPGGRVSDKAKKSRLTRSHLAWAIYRRKEGWTWKRIASELGVSVRTLYRRLPSLKRPRRAESRGSSRNVAALRGSHRLHEAHVVLDLWELGTFVERLGRVPTIADLAKIRGEA